MYKSDHFSNSINLGVYNHTHKNFCVPFNYSNIITMIAVITN